MENGTSKLTQMSRTLDEMYDRLAHILKTKTAIMKEECRLLKERHSFDQRLKRQRNEEDDELAARYQNLFNEETVHHSTRRNLSTC